MASKLTRMDTIEQSLGEVDMTDLREKLAEMAELAEAAEEARNAAEEAIAAARDAHEERDWETRNDSIEEANEQIELFADAMGNLSEFAGLFEFLNQQADAARKGADAAQKEMAHLL